MANIKSAKKRIKVIEKKAAQNKSKKSAIKTAEKKFLEAIAAGDIESAKAKFNFYEKKMAQNGASGLFHKNASARKISRLRKRLNAAAE